MPEVFSNAHVKISRHALTKRERFVICLKRRSRLELLGLQEWLKRQKSRNRSGT